MPQQSKFFADVPVPIITFDEFILSKIRSYGDEIALIEHNGRQLTYNQLVGQIYSVANALHARGLKKDDKIAVMLGNCIEFPVITLAAMILGAEIAPVNPVYTSYELSEHIKRCHAKMIISQEMLADIISEAVITSDPHIQVVLAMDEPNPKDSTDFASFLTFPSYKLNFTRPKMNPVEDVALLPSSSGTTGPPKCVMLTHHNLVAMFSFSLSPFAYHPFRTDTNCVVMPFYHIYGLFILCISLISGGKLVFMTQFNPLYFLQILQDYKISQLAAVPPMIVFLAKEPLVSKYDLSSLKFLMVGAAPLGEALSNDFLKRFPNVELLIQGYGMTEYTVGSHMAPPLPMSKMPLGSVGMIVGNCDCMIIDIKTGKELGPNETGEIWVRGPCVFKGYYNNEKATNETKDKDGWLHTGDIGHFDVDGFYFITDRLKELIKVRGFQVAPAELEDLLFQHPAVADCAVIGIPNEAAGELPQGFVVKNAGFDATAEQDIMDFVKGKVAHFKQLKGGVRFVESIPKSPSGKILRREIRKEYMVAKPVSGQSKL